MEFFGPKPKMGKSGEDMYQKMVFPEVLWKFRQLFRSRIRVNKRIEYVNLVKIPIKLGN